MLVWWVGNRWITREQRLQVIDQVTQLSSDTDKAKHMRAIFGTVERMAIIGDAGWMTVWATVFDPVTKPHLRPYNTDQGKEALACLREA